MSYCDIIPKKKDGSPSDLFMRLMSYYGNRGDAVRAYITAIEELDGEDTPYGTVINHMRNGLRDVYFDPIMSDADLQSAMEDAVSDYLVKGFTVKQQQDVINTINKQVIEMVEKGDGKVPMNSIYNEIARKFDIAWQRFKDAGDEAGAQRFEMIAKNWPLLAKLSARDLLRKYHGIISSNRSQAALESRIDKIIREGDSVEEMQVIESESEAGEDLENAISDLESIWSRITFSDAFAFKLNPKMTISTRLRQVFSFIPDGGVSDFGFQTYMDPDDVAIFLNQSLHGMKPDFNLMTEELLRLGKDQKLAWLNPLVQKLLTADKSIQNQFVSYASKHYAGFKTVLWKRDSYVDRLGDRQYYFSAYAIDTNQNSLAKKLVKEWQQSMADTLLEETGTGKYKAKVKEIQKLLDRYDKITDIDGLHKWLNATGIDIDKSSLRELLYRELKKNKKLKGVKALTNKHKVAYDIKSKLEEIVANSKFGDFDSNPFSYRMLKLPQLARAQARTAIDRFTNSHRNGNGDIVYSYSMNKYLVHKIQELIENPKTVEALAQLPLSRATDSEYSSFWLYHLRKDIPEWKRNFKVFYYDSIKNMGRSGSKELKEQTWQEFELSRATMFINENGPSEIKTGMFMMPAISEKATMPVIQAPKVAGAFKDGRPMTEHIYRIVKGEYNRIAEYQKSQSMRDAAAQIANYSEGAQLFYFFPQLNELAFDSDGVLIDVEQFESIAMEVIGQEMEKTINRQYRQWVEAGILSETGEMLTFTKEAKEFYGNDGRLLVTDFVVNYFIFNANVVQTIVGDPAQYFDKSVRKTWDNISKRLSALIAPGIDIPGSWDGKYKQLFLEDRKEASGLSEYFKSLGLSQKDLDKYNNIEITDGQELTTAQEHLDMMYWLGEVTESDYKAISSRLKKGQDLDAKQVKIILQPMKPVYAGQHVDIKAGLARMVYLKISSYPLLPQFTRGKEIDKLRKLMEAKDIKRAVFSSGAKVGAPATKLNIWNEDGSIKDGLETMEGIEDSTFVMDRKNLRIQQKVPVKITNKVTRGSQEAKLLFSGLLHLDGMDELNQRYHYLYKTLYNRRVHNIGKKLGGKMERGDRMWHPQGIKPQRLRRYIIDEAVARGWDLNDIEYLATDASGKPIIPFWLSEATYNIESLLTSIVSSEVTRIKFTGFSVVAGSPAGIKNIKTLDELTKDEVDKIIWTNKWDGKKLGSMTTKDGVVQPDQVIVPWKFKGELEQFMMTGENGRLMLDMDKIPPYMLKLFGFRIPTSKQNSMSYAEIVGFMPKEMGDLVIAPPELITRMGMDFDVDKLYFYNYAHEITEDGKLQVIREPKKIEDENGKKIDNLPHMWSEEAIINNILDIHFKVLEDPRSEVQKQIVSPINYGKLRGDVESSVFPGQVLADAIDEARSIREGLFNFLSPIYQRDKYINAQAARAYAVGVFSKDIVFDAILQGTDVRVSVGNMSNDDNLWIGTDPLNAYLDDEGNAYIKLGDTKVIGDNKRTKGDVHSAYQNAALDNEKNPVLNKLNVNKYTFNVIAAMKQIGYDEDMISLVTNQDAALVFVQELDKLNNGLNDEYVTDKVQEAYIRTIERITKKMSQEALTTLNGRERGRYKWMPQSGIQSISTDELKAYLEREGDPENYDDYALAQIHVLNKFMHFDGVGRSMLKVSTAIDVDSKHLDKSFVEVYDRNDKVEEVRWGSVDALQGVDELLESISGYATEAAVGSAIGLFAQDFPYNNDVIQTIYGVMMDHQSERRGDDDMKLSARAKKKILRSLRSYFFTNTQGYELQASEYRKKLTVGKESLAKQIRELRKQYPALKNNAFLFSLNLEFAESPGDPDLITFGGDSISTDDIIQLRVSFIEMFMHPDPLVRHVARQLADYALLFSGISSYNNFVKVLPARYLLSSHWRGILNNTTLDAESLGIRMGTPTMDNYNLLGPFVTQFFQHNSTYAPSIEKKFMRMENGDYFMTNTGIKKYGRQRPLIINGETESVVLPPVFLRYQGKLMMLSDVSGAYREIPVLGNGSFTEYDMAAKGPVTESIFNRPKEKKEAKKPDQVLRREARQRAQAEAQAQPQQKKTLPSPTLPETLLAKNYIKDVIGKIDATNPQLIALGQALEKILDSHPLGKKLVVRDAASGSMPHYDRNDHAIYIDKSRSTPNAFLHEVIHGLTVKAFTGDTKLNKREQNALNNLISTFNETKKALKENRLTQHGLTAEKFEQAIQFYRANFNEETGAWKNQKSKETFRDEYYIYYPFFNIKEFTAGLFTNPEFIDKMNEVELGKQTIWSRFVKAIQEFLRILGNAINMNSVLAAGVEQSLQLMGGTAVLSNSQKEARVKSKTRSLPGSTQPPVPPANMPDPINVPEIDPKANAKLVDMFSKKKDGKSFDPVGNTKTPQHIKDAIQFRLMRIKSLYDVRQKNLGNSTVLGEINSKIDALRDELDELRNSANLEMIIETAERDIQEVAARLNAVDAITSADVSFSIQLIEDAKQILSFYKLYKAGFTDQQFQEKDDLAQRYSNVLAQVTLLEEKWNVAAVKALTKVGKIHTKGTALESKITEESIMTMKDVDGAISQLFDLSRSNRTALQTLDVFLKKANALTKFETNDIFTKFDNLMKKVAETAEFKKNKWDLLLEKGVDGKPAGDLVYFIDKKFINMKNALVGQVSKVKNGASKLTKWIRENEITFDPSRLLKLNAEGKYDIDPDADYMNELRQHIPDSMLQRKLRSLKKKMDQWEVDKEAARIRFAGNDSLFDNWVNKNDPFEAYKVYSGQNINLYVTNVYGGKYLESTPRAFDASGKATPWISSQYKQIEKNKAFHELHDFLINQIADYYEVLPMWRINDNISAAPNTLPRLKKKSFADLWRKGSTTAEKVSAINEWFRSQLDMLPDHVSDVDPITGRERKQIPLLMLNNKVDAADLETDVEKIFRSLTVSAMNYKHKSQVEDVVKLLSGVIREGGEVREGDVAVRGGDNLQNVIRMVDYAMDVFYGKRDSRDSKIGRYTPKENKAKVAKEKEKLRNARNDLKAGAITKEQFDAIQKKHDANIEALTKPRSAMKAARGFIGFAHIMFMGLNVGAGIANMFTGFVNNLIQSSGGSKYNETDFIQAFGKVMKIVTTRGKDFRKFKALMKRFDILNMQSAAAHEAEFGNNDPLRKAIDASFFFQEMGEWVNQGTIFLANIDKVKVKDAKGNEVSLWDAFDENGMWDVQKMGENSEYAGDYSNLLANKGIIRLKYDIGQQIKEAHGNYAYDDSAYAAKKTILGKLLMVMRGWLPESTMVRYGGERYDVWSDQDRTGRFRALWHLMKQNDLKIGNVDLTPAIKFLRAVMPSQKTKALEELEAEGYIKSEAQMLALREMVMEMRVLVGVIMLGVLIRALWDDDDEDSGAFKFTINLANRFMADSVFWVNPYESYKVMENPVPVLGIVRNFFEFFSAVGGYVMGDDVIQAGPYAGQSRLGRETIQLLPFSNAAWKLYAMTQQEY